MSVHLWMCDRGFSKHFTFRSTHGTTYSYFMDVLLEYKRDRTFVIVICYCSLFFLLSHNTLQKERAVNSKWVRNFFSSRDLFLLCFFEHLGVVTMEAMTHIFQERDSSCVCVDSTCIQDGGHLAATRQHKILSKLQMDVIIYWEF